MDLLKVLFQDAFPRIENLKQTDAAFCEKLEAMSEGCVFLTIKRDGLEDLFMPVVEGQGQRQLDGEQARHPGVAHASLRH